jgi:hypothetical protein
MKRDMELIRLILLDVEGDEKPDLSGYTEEQQVYHMALLIEAEMIKGAVGEDQVGYPKFASAIRLTWQGHEFLDAARNPSIWKKSIEKLKSAGASLPLPVIQEMLISLLKKQVGLE